MSEIDVGVGIKVTGDASGAQQVDAAVKQVGETAKQVAQETGRAAAQAADAAAGVAKDAAGNVEELADALESAGSAAPKVGELDEAIGGLKNALGTLSPEKAKGAVTGLTNAIMGLASGDSAKGLAGLSQSLFSLAQAIPVPGAAIGLSLALTGLVTAFKLLKPAIDDATPVLNEFGLTVDEEMANIEAWANKKIEWTNLTSGFADAKEEIEATNKLIDTLRTTLQTTFDRSYKIQIEGLKEELEAARASGDSAAQARIEEQIKRAEQTKAIVDNTLAVDRLKDKLQAQIEAAELERRSIEQREIIAQRNIEAMDALRLQMEQRGAGDAMYSSDTSAQLRAQEIERLTAEIKNLGDSIAMAERTRAGTGINQNSELLRGLGVVPEETLQGMRTTLEQLQTLKQGLMDFENVAEAAAEGQKFMNEESFKAVQGLDQMMAEAVQTKGEIAAAEAQLADSMTGADQSVRVAADAYVASQREATQKSVDAIQDGVSKLDPAAAVVESAGNALSGKVEELGAGVGGSSEAAAEVIGESTGMIQGAIEGAAAEAAGAGEEIKKGAEEFRGKIGDAANLMRDGANELVNSARRTLDLVSEIAVQQAELAARVAAVQSQVRMASADASLALSQIRNA